MAENSVGRRYLTVKEARQIVPLSLPWYNRARLRGEGPPFIRVGGRVFYPLSDFLNWAESHKIHAGGLEVEAA